MRPSSLGGGRILRRTLSVCLSVRPVIGCEVFYFTVEPSYERTSKIEKLRFSLMGQRHVCTFRHALKAAYRTAISAAQILVIVAATAAADIIPFSIVMMLLSSRTKYAMVMYCHYLIVSLEERPRTAFLASAMQDVAELSQRRRSCSAVLSRC